MGADWRPRRPDIGLIKFCRQTSFCRNEKGLRLTGVFSGLFPLGYHKVVPEIAFRLRAASPKLDWTKYLSDQCGLAGIQMGLLRASLSKLVDVSSVGYL